MRTFLVYVLILVSFGAQSQDQWKNVYSENAWTSRDVWQRADDIIKQLRIKAGSQVADIGCHEGYMTVKLASKVGSKGSVYAVDLDTARLTKLKRHLGARKITNVTAIKGLADDPQLPTDLLDGALIVDTYHEMKEHDKILQHILNALHVGGRLVICEPIAQDRRSLPRADQEKRHELGMSFAIDDMKRAGFQIVFQQDPFVDREIIKGDKMWLLVGVKKLKN